MSLRLMRQLAKRLRGEETAIEAKQQPNACATKQHLMHAKVYHNPPRLRTESGTDVPPVNHAQDARATGVMELFCG
jgi:hypothetical protein